MGLGINGILVEDQNKDNVVIVIFIPAIKLERLIAGADQRCSALLRFDPAAGIVLEIR
jgi:hypothetical protein